MTTVVTTFKEMLRQEIRGETFRVKRAIYETHRSNHLSNIEDFTIAHDLGLLNWVK